MEHWQMGQSWNFSVCIQKDSKFLTLFIFLRLGWQFPVCSLIPQTKETTWSLLSQRQSKKRNFEAILKFLSLLSPPVGKSQVPAPPCEGGNSAAGGPVYWDHHWLLARGSPDCSAPPLSTVKGLCWRRKGPPTLLRAVGSCSCVRKGMFFSDPASVTWSGPCSQLCMILSTWACGSDL